MQQALSTGGADMDAPNRAGVTPLIASSFFGHEAVVRALLARGANARAVCARRRSALHYAALADQRPVQHLNPKPCLDGLLMHLHVRAAECTVNRNFELFCLSNLQTFWASCTQVADAMLTRLADPSTERPRILHQ